MGPKQEWAVLCSSPPSENTVHFVHLLNSRAAVNEVVVMIRGLLYGMNSAIRRQVELSSMNTLSPGFRYLTASMAMALFSAICSFAREVNATPSIYFSVGMVAPPWVRIAFPWDTSMLISLRMVISET